jgi:ABC-type phosphate transport system permease subunit
MHFRRDGTRHDHSAFRDFDLPGRQSRTASLVGFSDHQSDKRHEKGGVWSALLGTIYLVTCSLLVAAPIGVFAAVYLNEYAKDTWFTRIINLAVVNLAGVPSIVHALFGLGAFVLFANRAAQSLQPHSRSQS